MSVPEGHPFALCLTHDVDRPYKSAAQALYYAVVERRPGHLRSLFTDENPYWQFEEIAELEAAFGVRSAFYFLSEPHLLFERPAREWPSPGNWVQHLGRYDVLRDDLAAAIRRLDEGGWEVGLHGSTATARDRERMATEKRRVESVLGHPVVGGRQHYLELSIPETWRHQSALGMRYDASLGSATDYGFEYGYGLRRPFDDEFVVFPLTLMEQTLPDPGTDFERAWGVIESLLAEAAEHDAVMTVLWHPRYFNEAEFPGYRRLYRRLLARAVEADAWIGPPADLYERLDHDGAPSTSPGAPRPGPSLP